MGGVVIHHVHDHPNARFVQPHDHCLELAHAHFAAVRISGIGTFRDVVVERIVTPVVRGLWARFVDG